MKTKARARRHRPARANPGRRIRLWVERLEDRTVPSNAIVTENQLPGNPASEWDVSGAGDSTLQGFATDLSVDQGQTVSFKIRNTALAPYRLDIYRMGYYGGLGARKVTTIPSSQTLRQAQPNPLTNASTGLVDAGNWAVSASWAVPATATSGIYFARAVREDTGGASHIFFVVRDDDGRSDLLFQTADTTWQAYNRWGGNSLYVGTAPSSDGRAYKVSYNRPFTTREYAPEDWVFNAEYPMVRWLEANGYSVSYFTDIDSDRRGAEILEHKVFLSVGHDEYWSASQWANVEAARNAGVHLAFFSGNEVFWKTRWENSLDASGTPYRTLVCYKETKANAKIDPSPVWTGTWRDPRFSPPADGGRPENALTGTIFEVNGYRSDSITVPAADGKMRFWRHTSIATLAAGQTATLPAGTLGYEWDEDADNGFRPAGLFRLSTTTVNNAPILLDYGNTYGSGTATHHLTMYRHSSGALVFGSGTVQWSWGLDANHAFAGPPADTRMRQATVNLFADMGVQPGSLQPGLVAATASTDLTAPTATITSPANGATLQPGTAVTVTGTASDTGGGVVGGVEVSTDGGATWHPAVGRASWSYNWTAGAPGTVTIRSRAVDDSGNLQGTPANVTVTVAGPPGGLVAAYGFNEGAGTTTADASGAGNAGAVSGAAWATAGRFGGALSFDGVNDWVTVADAASLDLTTAMTVEAWVRLSTINGWETVLMKESAGTYAYGLYADDNGNDAGQPRRPAIWIVQGGGYSGVQGAGQLPVNTWTHLAGTYDGSALRLYVNGAPAGTLSRTGPIDVTAGPLRIGGNGVWGEYFNGLIDEVRVYSRVLSQAEIQSDMNTPVGGADTAPPTVSSVAPANGATGVAANANVTATFSEPMDPATVTTSTFELRDSANALVPATVAYNSGTNTATLDPTASLTFGVTYTARVKGGSGGVKDAAGNPLAADFTWSFTAASSPPPPTLSINDVSVTEGNSGTVNAVFTVTLSASSTQTVTVTYATANGTATAGSDYTSVPPTTLTFSPGQTSKTVTVSVLGDTASEGNETFLVNLTNPANATLADSQGQGTIVDDEAVHIGSDGFGYSAFTTPFDAVDLVQGGPGVITIRSTGGNHTNTVNFPAGNSFNLYGTSYTSLIVSTNGLIAFGTGTNSATNTDLTSSPTQRSIAPLWDDWEDITSSAMILGKYEDTDGNGSNDRLVIEWNVQGAPISPSTVMFQAILKLNTGTSPGAFTFNYADTDSGDSRTDGASATVGIKDSGTQGANRLLVQFNGTSPYVGSGKAIRFTFAPDTTSPAVSVTSPAQGATVSGTITVTANASDNVGVAGVQFLLDGANLGAEDTAAPYSVSWNTTTAANGSHSLTARARDAAGNQTTSPVVTFTVSNPTGGTGPVAAYGFNEGSGGTAGDGSGTGNTGTISGAAWTTAGRFGNALSFDGVNDWVTVADAASLDLTTAMTVEAWVRPTALSGWRTVIMKEAGTEQVYAIFGNEDVARPLGTVRIAGTYKIATGAASLALNTWTHLASTYDGATLRLYVNGAQVGSMPATGSIEVSSGVLRIGGNAIWGEYFAGLIDEVRVYNRALSQSEIQTDMNTPIGSPERLMGEAVAAGDSVALSQHEFRPLFEEAVTRWAVALGEATAVQRLRAVRVEVLDLPGTTLGLASGAVIYLDTDGAGHGWFVDQSPWEDSEFTPVLIDSAAAGRVDLLTVMSHELGHILGLDDDPATDPFTGNVMADVLPVGVRRIHLQGLVSHAPAPARAEDLTVEALPGGSRIAIGLRAVPVFATSFAPAAPLLSERNDGAPQRASPGTAKLPELPAQDLAAPAPALFEPRAVIVERKELDLVFVELVGIDPFDRNWWPAL